MYHCSDDQTLVQVGLYPSSMVNCSALDPLAASSHVSFQCTLNVAEHLRTKALSIDYLQTYCFYLLKPTMTAHESLSLDLIAAASH